MGLNLNNLIEIDKISSVVPTDKAQDVLNLNLYSLGLACDDTNFLESLNSASYLHFDGIGAAFIYRIVSGTWVRSSGYRAWAPKYLETRPEGTEVLAIGGTKEESLAFRDSCQTLMPHLKVQVLDGYQTLETILNVYKAAKPDICFVGMGMPLQEKTIKVLKQQNQGGLLFACGGWIKQFGGLEEDVPQSFRKYGMEWLYRSLHRRGHFYNRVLWPASKICKHYVSLS